MSRDASSFGEGARRAAQPSEDERLVLAGVDRYLSDGLALKRWWDQTYASDAFAEKFELERVFNRPDTSFGFFDCLRLARGPLAVMGNYQKMLYDRPRTPTSLKEEAARWMQDQVREFVLRYFMRVSDFRQPEVYVAPGGAAPPRYLEALSWCPREDVRRQGFGFRQLYYKRRGTGEVGRFSEAEETAIVDLREIGTTYEWVVVRVRIFDFKFTFQPFGPGGLEVAVPLEEASYLVLTRDFITNEDAPAPGIRGRYGLGYAFIKEPERGVVAYGPGQFDAAIELITFTVLESGETAVEMVFVVNRPERIASVELDPFGWGFRLADLFSFGLATRLLEPVRGALRGLPTSVGSFDPVYGYVSLANALTGDEAGRRLCITREQLEKDFLAQHFMQHYTALSGSLVTWRQVPDWLDEARLPEWIVAGRSS